MKDEENRTYSRQDVQNMSVDISDGHGFYSGSISNISQKGLCLQHVSKKLDDDINWLMIVVTKNDANFKMSVRPRWRKYNGFTKDIGVRIVDAPPGWEQYVQKAP